MNESIFVLAAAFAVPSHMLPCLMGKAAQGRVGHQPASCSREQAPNYRFTGPLQKLCLRTLYMPQIGIEVGKIVGILQAMQAVLLHLLHWMQIVGAAVKLQNVPGLSSWQA